MYETRVNHEIFTISTGADPGFLVAINSSSAVDSFDGHRQISVLNMLQEPFGVVSGHLRAFFSVACLVLDESM